MKLKNEACRYQGNKIPPNLTAVNYKSMFYMLVQEWNIPVNIHGHIQIYLQHAPISITYPHFTWIEHVWKKPKIRCMHLSACKNRVFPKNNGIPKNHPLKNRVFHDFHHPFWGFHLHADDMNSHGISQWLQAARWCRPQRTNVDP